MRNDPGLKTGLPRLFGQGGGIPAPVLAEREVPADDNFGQGREFQFQQRKEFGGAHGGEFAGEGQGVNLADAAGAHPGLVLLRRGQQQRGPSGIEELRHVRRERQASGDAIARGGRFDRSAENRLVAQMHAIELTNGQHERGRYRRGRRGHGLNIQYSM